MYAGYPFMTAFAVIQWIFRMSERSPGDRRGCVFAVVTCSTLDELMYIACLTNP